MNKILFLICISLLMSTCSYAKHTKRCKAKYETQSGWSKYYDVEVIFLSGSELNTATNSYSYSAYNMYAVIFWSESEASVIKTTHSFKSGEVISFTVTNAAMLGNIKGTEQDGDKWEICTSMVCY